MALLKPFAPMAERDIEVIWHEGIFIFDTSFLLNLHRYRDSARDDFLKAMATLSGQIWIPFHVAVEYEFNRPKVISDKNRSIEKTKAKVASITDEVRGHLTEAGAFRRHSHIDAEQLI